MAALLNQLFSAQVSSLSAQSAEVGNRDDVPSKGAAAPNTQVHHMSPCSFMRRQISSSRRSSLKSCTALSCTFAENHHLESPCNTNASNVMGHLRMAGYRILDHHERRLQRALEDAPQKSLSPDVIQSTSFR